MSIKKEDVRYDSKNNFIVLTAQKEPSIENMKQHFKQILEISEIENCKNVLINATKTIDLPTVWNLHTMGFFMSKQALKLMKMRLAFAINDEIKDKFRTFDTVLTNRMVNINIFKNVADAKEWLLSKK